MGKKLPRTSKYEEKYSTNTVKVAYNQTLTICDVAKRSVGSSLDASVVETCADTLIKDFTNLPVINKIQTNHEIIEHLVEQTYTNQPTVKEEANDSITTVPEHLLLSSVTPKIDTATGSIKRTNCVKSQRNPPYCKICSKIFTSYKVLSKHKEEHTGKRPYKCLNCEQTYANLEELKAHLRLHQGKLPYECKKCHKGFKTMKHYKDHQPLHILRKTALVERQYECEFCCKKFKKISDLERHTRVHTGEKPAVCNICNKRFHQSHNLTKHLLIHIQARPFKCEICGKDFRRSDVLSRHFLIHSLVKPYHCSHCNKGFIRMSQLNAHIVKVHNKQSQQ